jgi:tetratricopeptide (TPR) repeat protein
VNKGSSLIQLAQVEKDEKTLALQFGMADILCEIHEYSAALPLLKQILACLKAIEGDSQRNVNAVLDQLCTVYYKESKTPELATLLEEWAVPDIQLDDPSLALETWRKKARACMNYNFHGKAIPLLERIQSYLTAQPEPQQAEILENRCQLAECLELTNQIAEAVDMYNSIIDSTSGNSTFNTPDRLLRSRVFQGLGDIYREKSERPLAISMFEKALEEVKACEDKQSNDVR